MTLLPRRVLVLTLSASFAAAFAQQSGPASGPVAVATNESSSRIDMDPGPSSDGVTQVAAASVTPSPWSLGHYGIGSYSSPLGFGGRIAISLTHSLNLRVGGSYLSFGTTRTVSDIPFSVNVLLQSEQASFDWYPFHNSFHFSPGVLFGSSNRAYGSASIPEGDSFTLNNATYYSGAADPVNASGSVRFAHTAPTFTLGCGNWVRGGESQRHWAFPFEMGFAYMGNPQTALNFTGVACTDAAQQYCQNIANDPSIQANIAVEQKKLQDDANWLSFYPIVAGGIVYRF